MRRRRYGDAHQHLIPGSIADDERKAPRVNTIDRLCFDEVKSAWLSSRFGIEQDPEFRLKLPPDDYAHLDPDIYIPDDTNVSFRSAEHAMQVQRYHYVGRDKILNIKYFEYREILMNLMDHQDIMAMGNMELGHDYTPAIRMDAPRWVYDKFVHNTIARVVKEYQDFGVRTRPDWDSIKANVCYFVTSMKFEQNPELANRLKQTIGKRLIYTADPYWGNVDFGDNRLGWILMTIRDLLLTKL